MLLRCRSGHRRHRRRALQGWAGQDWDAHRYVHDAESPKCGLIELAGGQSSSPVMLLAGTAAVVAGQARLRAGEVSAALDAQGAARIRAGQAGRAERP